MGELLVRLAEDGDLDAIVSLLHEMHGKGSTGGPTTHEREVFASLLRQRGRHLLVGELDRIVGTADLIVVENLSRDGRSWAMIENVVVEERFRRRGIATALLTEAVARATAGGCYKVQLISNETRSAAHELYRKLGFDAPVRGFRRYLEDVES